MQKKSPQPQAFSLVEIAVVLAIISSVIAGIIKAQTLFARSRLSTAKTLTQNAPVKDTPDLKLWYETSLESSFLYSEEQDGGTISVWHDNNAGAPSKNNAVQNTAANKPKIYEGVFNGAIPGVRFDGVDDFMTFDGSALVGTSYTVFVVAQRRSSDSPMMFMGGTDAVTVNGNLFLGYRSDTLITHAQSSTIYNDFTVSAYSKPEQNIHTFWLSTYGGQKYWLNGGSTADDTSVGMTTPLVSYSGTALGRYLTHYFNGDIAEIIIFSRALQSTERQTIETYLSQKYGIGIS